MKKFKWLGMLLLALFVTAFAGCGKKEADSEEFVEEDLEPLEEEELEELEELGDDEIMVIEEGDAEYEALEEFADALEAEDEIPEDEVVTEEMLDEEARKDRKE